MSTTMHILLGQTDVPFAKMQMMPAAGELRARSTSTSLSQDQAGWHVPASDMGLTKETVAGGRGKEELVF